MIPSAKTLIIKIKQIRVINSRLVQFFHYSILSLPIKFVEEPIKEIMGGVKESLHLQSCNSRHPKLSNGRVLECLLIRLLF